MSLMEKHGVVERHSFVLLLGILVLVSIGGLVEVVPLFFLKGTIETTTGVRPRTPLEQAGFDIYVREGCYNCHSQMIRPMRDEIERYGHFSLAAESQFDHPFQWGSKRTGPDLARVGGKYSDAWHVQHLEDPRQVSPASVMPGYPFLATQPLDISHIDKNLATLRIVGVPYTDDQIASAQKDVVAQTEPDSPEAKEFAKRWPTAIVRNFSGKRGGDVTELDALVAYLQQIGTQVDFSIYDEKANLR